jgi:hypothetical protein
MKTKGEYTYREGKKTSAAAVHVESDDGKGQAVGISLRVLIQPDGKFWYAQGLEIDYGAQGATPEAAREHFEKGLSGTITLHLQKHGHIEKLLKRVDNKTWKEAISNQVNIETFSQVSFHSIDAANADVFPYPMIEYYQSKAA